ncbi:hypothetical protein [Caldalkalibacillus mannanilyticus]|uniref:hypothetical protein n=1 Tax=Caldalkalibacillus mannanilyticus TaxID=1418 RepID=UPI000468EEF6|nr:hypothetical protein [Caldalkalibacillus mannanilyticus]
MKNAKWLVFILLVSIMTFVGCTNKEDVSTNQETEGKSNLVEDVDVEVEAEEEEDNIPYFTHEEIKEKWNNAADKLGVKDKIGEFKIVEVDDSKTYTYQFNDGLELRLHTDSDHKKIYFVVLAKRDKVNPTIKGRFDRLVIYTVYPEASDEEVEYILDNIENETVYFEDHNIRFWIMLDKIVGGYYLP